MSSAVALVTGLLQGFLHCVGTIPALFAVAAAGTYGGAKLKARGFNDASAAVVAAGGFPSALRGLAVNGWVPHLWPWPF